MTDTTTTANILFSELNLTESVLRAVEDSGYTQPSPIQAQTIPHVMSGRDVLGQAQTGTGKTAAFALPTLQKINAKSKETQILVLTPTRELAIQVSDSYKRYAKYLNEVRILPVYGGSDYRTQLQGLKRGAHVVVGTPGRVMDHIERGTLNLDSLNTLILDEADEMLRMGFIDDVEWILSKSADEKQIVLFSATMPRQIKQITEKYLRDEVVVKIASKTETAATVEQFHLGIEHKQKSAALRRILEIENRDATIVFVNTKAATEELAEMLNHRGYRAAAINGDLQQKQRERVIEQLKVGLIDIVLATDVAARGLDVERISHVINYDLPHDSESYVHRIGRTGRAGRSGKAILLVTPREKRALGFIEKDNKIHIPVYPMPDLETINAHRIERFKQRIIDESEHKKLGYLEELLVQMHKDHAIDPFSMAAALASMVLDKTPLLLGKREAVCPIDMHEFKAADRKTSRRGRKGKENASSKERKDKLPLSEMDSFRLAVGYNDNVRPGNIVGAIANEAGLSGSHIGPIEIYDDYTDVMLPKGMPENVFEDLKKARIMNKELAIKKLSGKQGNAEKSRGKRKRKTEKVAVKARRRRR